MREVPNRRKKKKIRKQEDKKKSEPPKPEDGEGEEGVGNLFFFPHGFSGRRDKAIGQGTARAGSKGGWLPLVFSEMDGCLGGKEVGEGDFVKEMMA